MNLKTSFSLIIFLSITIAHCRAHEISDSTQREEIILSVYEFLETLIEANYEGCDVNILHTNTNSRHQYSDAQEDFQAHLTRHGHWVQIKAVQLDVKPKGFDTISSTKSKISMNGRHSRNICHIYILEIWNPQFIPSFVRTIKENMYPTPLRFAKCILINWRAFASSFISMKGFQPSLLQQPILQKLLHYKVEVTISYRLNGNDTHRHVLLYGSDFECKPNNPADFAESNFKLLGAFSEEAGFRNYMTNKGLFPINTGNFCQMKLHVAVPNLSGVEQTRTSRKRQDLKIAKRMFRELNFHVDSSSYIYLEGQHEDEQLAKIFARYPMAVGITHFQGRTNKYKFRFSKHFGLETLIMIYRTKVNTDKNPGNTRGIVKTIHTSSFVILLGATVFLLLSKRWDLFSKARLPRPLRNGQSWKYHDRRITLSRWLDCYWEVNQFDISAKCFPQLNLKRYAPSATIMLTFFCLCSSFKYFCVKLSTMTFIDRPTRNVQFLLISEALDVVKSGIYNSEPLDVKLVTVVHKQFWSRYIQTTEQNETKQNKTLRPTTMRVDTAEQCVNEVIKANLENQCYICLGIFDYDFRKEASKAFENDRNRELRYQRAGISRLISLVYDENFPWVDAFEDKMTRFIESGIFSMWIDRRAPEFSRSRKESVKDRFTSTIGSASIFSIIKDLTITSSEFAVTVFMLELFITKRKLIWKTIKNLMKYLGSFLTWVTRNCFDWKD